MGATTVEAGLTLRALPGIGRIQPGDDLVEIIASALQRGGLVLQDGDIIAVTSKIVSRAENRFVDLSQVVASGRALGLAAETAKDPALVQLVLDEAERVSRAAPGVLLVRHRLGFVSANAGIDASNVASPPGHASPGPWVLLLPEAPDQSAERLRQGLQARTGATLAVVITDSHGRPFRYGTVGVAVGLAGLPAVWDQRGQPDLDGRILQFTITALADQVAAAADLVAGQAAEGRPVVLVRGVRFVPARDGGVAPLLREPEGDLYL